MAAREATRSNHDTRDRHRHCKHTPALGRIERDSAARSPGLLWCVCAEILNDLNHAVSWVLMGTHPWGLFRQVQTFAIQTHLSLQQLRVFRHKKVRSNRVHVGSRMITHIAYAVGEFTSAYIELRFFLDAIVQRRRRLGQSSPTCTQLDCGFRTHHHLCYHSLAFRNSHNPTF